MPPPELAYKRIGLLVVLSPKLTFFTILCHNQALFVKYGCKYTKKRGIMSTFA